MRKNEAFYRLVKIINELREKCPWDKKQTNESLRTLTIEECYELSDSILKNDSDAIKKELGDLLTHIIFYSKIGLENKEYSIEDVIEDQCEKLIRRHPHIYGDVSVENEDDVKRNWEIIKLKESKNKKSILDGVPKSLPAMLKSWRIQEKVGGIGFEWENTLGFLDKIKEEIDELKIEISKKNKIKMEEELGDLLFAMINFSRSLDINPVNSLEKANQKFTDRFSKMEEKILKDKKKIEKMKLTEFDFYWNNVKKDN